jgi:hypothetical protein
MNVTEFRSKIKVGAKLSIDRENFYVKEVVKFRFDNGSYYIKCFLDKDFVLADDLNENMFVLVQETTTEFHQPFPTDLDFNSKKFRFLYQAHAIAEETQGEEIFKKGDSERFWDYKSDDESYLSLGINDKTNQKQDFFGKIVKNNTLKFS